MRNRLRLPTLAITGVLLLVACGGGATPSPSATGSAPPAASQPPAASGSAPSGSAAAAGAIPEQGVDDGTKITMWSRAATETRVQSQVDEYNKTHKNQVELRLVPTDEYVGVVGNA